MNDESFLSVVPPKYREAAMLAGILIPWIGRGYKALKEGGGLRGLWHNIYYGGDAPKS